jgi:hypothetical protein
MPHNPKSGQTLNPGSTGGVLALYFERGESLPMMRGAYDALRDARRALAGWEPAAVERAARSLARIAAISASPRGARAVARKAPRHTLLSRITQTEIAAIEILRAIAQRDEARTTSERLRLLTSETRRDRQAMRKRQATLGSRPKVKVSRRDLEAHRAEWVAGHPTPHGWVKAAGRKFKISPKTVNAIWQDENR